jgi:hypothetical protein
VRPIFIANSSLKRREKYILRESRKEVVLQELDLCCYACPQKFGDMTGQYYKWHGHMEV